MDCCPTNMFKLLASPSISSISLKVWWLTYQPVSDDPLGVCPASDRKIFGGLRDFANYMNNLQIMCCALAPRKVPTTHMTVLELRIQMIIVFRLSPLVSTPRPRRRYSLSAVAHLAAVKLLLSLICSCQVFLGNST